MNERLKDGINKILKFLMWLTAGVMFLVLGGGISKISNIIGGAFSLVGVSLFMYPFIEPMYRSWKEKKQQENKV